MPPSNVAHWAALYEPQQLVSAKAFDLHATARSQLDVALHLAGATTGFLALLRAGLGLCVLAARGVDPDAVLADPTLGPLCERLLAGQGATHHPLPPGSDLQGHAVLALPVRLEITAPHNDPLHKPLGVLAVLPDDPLSDPVRAHLEHFAVHASRELSNAVLFDLDARDPLTGLHRRAQLHPILSVDLRIARHTQTPTSLVLADLDHARRLNDRLGRARTDTVLARVAALLKSLARPHEACLRYAGDAFAWVLPGADLTQAQDRATELRAAITDYARTSDLPLSISCGIACAPTHADSASELIRKADQALYLASQRGDHTRVWDPQVPPHTLRSDKLTGVVTGDLAKDARNVMILLDAILAVASLHDRHDAARTLLDALLQLTSCQRAFLSLPDLTLGVDPRGHSLEPDETAQAVLDHLRANTTPLTVLGDRAEGPPELADLCHDAQLARVIALPLRVAGLPHASLVLDAATPPDDQPPLPELDESDLVFARACARELANALERAHLRTQLEHGATQPSDSAPEARDYRAIVGESEAMQKVFNLLDRITDHDVPILILGETGTGKELVARALHFNGPRRERPFVSVNCSALTESLMESELFGHVKGAFTGAESDKVGLFEQAHTGTIFLDEVQDMSPALQRELLRVLQEREVRRVGGKDMIPVDVRVISAANRDLRAMVRDAEFRQDLYYRLNVVTTQLPPLRDRKEDLPLLVERFLRDARTPDGAPIKLDQDALRAVLRYDWPGNIRQLRNAIDKALLLIDGDTIRAEHLRLDGAPRDTGAPGVSSLFEADYKDAKQAFVREYLKAVLARNGGNVTRAAAEAGIVRSSFHKMMRKHDLHAKDYTSSKSVTH